MENLFSCLPLDSDQPQPQPWLLISQHKNLRSHTFYSPSKKQYFKRKIPEFHMKQVSSASYGWLFIIDHSRCKQPLDCYLLNPLAPQQRIQLPPIKIEPGIACQCLLSKPPTDMADCRVLILADRYLFYCQLGDQRFIQKKSYNDIDHISLATSLNGKIYSCKRRGRFLDLFEVDFVGEWLVRNHSGRTCEIPWSCRDRFNEYVVEYSGSEFLLVHMKGHPHIEENVAYFRVFKVNVIEMESEELTNIGDQAIFISKSGGMSLLCTEKSGLMKNSIYYELGSRNIYVYNMEDRSKTIFRACNAATSLFKSWIMI